MCHITQPAVKNLRLWTVLDLDFVSDEDLTELSPFLADENASLRILGLGIYSSRDQQFCFGDEQLTQVPTKTQVGEEALNSASMRQVLGTHCSCHCPPKVDTCGQ